VTALFKKMVAHVKEFTGVKVKTTDEAAAEVAGVLPAPNPVEPKALDKELLSPEERKRLARQRRSEKMAAIRMARILPKRRRNAQAARRARRISRRKGR